MGRFTTFIHEVERLRSEVERIHTSHRRVITETGLTRIARGSEVSLPTVKATRTPTPCEANLARVVQDLERSLALIWRLDGHVQHMETDDIREAVAKLQLVVADLGRVVGDLVRTVVDDQVDADTILEAPPR